MPLSWLLNNLPIYSCWTDDDISPKPPFTLTFHRNKHPFIDCLIKHITHNEISSLWFWGAHSDTFPSWYDITLLQNSLHTVHRYAIEHYTIEHFTIEHYTIEHNTIDHYTIENCTVEHCTIEPYEISPALCKSKWTFMVFSIYTVWIHKPGRIVTSYWRHG